VKSYYGGIRHDYKLSADQPRATRWRAWALFTAGAALPLLTVAMLMNGNRDASELAPPVTSMAVAAPIAELTETAIRQSVAAISAEAAPVAAPIEAPIEAPPVADEPSPDEPDQTSSQFDTLELIVARNDTLDALFRRNGLSISDLAEMLDIPLAAEPLRRLIPGDRLNVVHRGADVISLERELRDDALLSITREPTGFTATEIPRDIEIRVVGRHGVVKSSLFEAGMAAEIPDAVIMRMAGIFQWDIDFILDVRVDDDFTLLYEERWREGEFLGSGSILAAEYVNRGDRYRVVRFEDPDGFADYYTEDGRSVRKAFVRAPVEFTRISSSFNPNRRHPVLNTIRAHRGVDYAAPTGTPVIAAGAGKIIRRSAYGSFGNTVILQHGGNITTLYAHLSRFGRPRLGARVGQGDVIGYVGQTGLASGPHLHYEYRISGVHRNPRTVDLPPADPVPEAYRAQFADRSEVLWQRLDAFRRTVVAATN
jgi:murein DD-endopeptidase MepM/ murein hydrolase activator NlpD